jgi:hypothetical protein
MKMAPMKPRAGHFLLSFLELRQHLNVEVQDLHVREDDSKRVPRADDQECLRRYS